MKNKKQTGTIKIAKKEILAISGEEGSFNIGT